MSASDEAQLWLPPWRRGSGRYWVTAEFDEPPAESAAAALRTVIDVLQLAGNRGAFPAGGSSPRSSRLVIGEAAAQGDRRLIYPVTGEDFDLHGFELLRNMCSRLTLQGIDVPRINVVAQAAPKEPGRLKPEPDDDDEDEAYPDTSPHVRFALENESFDVGKLRRCLLTLAVVVEASHVERVRHWIAPWFDLLEAGAYSLPAGPAWETRCVRGRVELFDERSIEITVDRFQASEMAWSGLINVLDTCWSEGSPIRKLMIE